MKTNVLLIVSVMASVSLSQTNEPYQLRSGDEVVVLLRNIHPKDEQMRTVIDPAGIIRLPHIAAITTRGKTTSDLEREIQKSYVDGNVYSTATVNIVLPAASNVVSTKAGSVSSLKMPTDNGNREKNPIRQQIEEMMENGSRHK